MQNNKGTKKRPALDADKLLLCRDFFLFTALKDGATLERNAISSAVTAPEPEQDAERFRRWATGRTGFPFVDACMRELAATGYMSNRGRQNVSSFLCKARPPAACNAVSKSSGMDPC